MGVSQRKGVWWATKGWVRCVFVCVLVCVSLCVRLSNSLFHFRLQIHLHMFYVCWRGCGWTFASRMSPVRTGVGVSSVQTRFGSCCHPSSLLSSLLSSLPSSPLTDVATPPPPLRLFMGPACFDFKYLPRRRLFTLGKGVGGVEEERGMLLKRRTYSHKHTCRA